MKITVDTNVLIRSVVRDDPRQADVANRVLGEASLVVIPLPCLCEFAWVLRNSYEYTSVDIAAAIEVLSYTNNVVMNRLAVEEGLAVLRAGGDFADGVIAHEGLWAGGDTFVSFDKKAVKLLAAKGYEARLAE